MEQIRAGSNALRWLSERHRETLAFWQDAEAVRRTLGEDLARPSRVRDDLIERARFRAEELEELASRIGGRSQEEWTTPGAAHFFSAVDLNVVDRPGDELTAAESPLPQPVSTLGTPEEREQYAAALRAMHTQLEAYLAANP